MNFRWVEGFEISVKAEHGAVIISANREGLLSLANHLTDLAKEPACGHFHLDQWNSLENRSMELVIEKVDTPEHNDL